MEVNNIDKIEISTQFPKMSERFKENLKWIRENRNKLTRYENNWIVVFNKEVVAFSSNPYELEKQIKTKNIEINDLVIQYMVDSNCVF